jgi:uncharacterized protein (TIRG00374 family)
MQRYKDMLIRKKSTIKMIRNLIFFILLIVFTFWFIFKDQDINELIKTIQSVNIGYVLIGAFFMFMTYIMEAYNVRSVLVALGERKIPILKALKFTWIGFFFSAITPAATGGQPVEIYYMTKDGIKGANGTMTMLLQLIGFQVATLTYSVIFAVLNADLLKDGIIWFYLLGLAINGFALIMMIFGTFSNKTAHKLLGLVIKILKRIKVKNLEGKQKKLEEGLKQYSESAKFIKKNKIVFVKAILRVFVQIFIFHSIPYFIYRAFGLNELSFIRLFAMQAVLYTTVSGIPLPGSIGVSETLFLKIFGLAFGSTLLSSAMLLYRFASFYLYVIIFAVISFIVATKTKDVIGEVDQNIIDVEKDLYKDKKSSKK